MTANTGSQSLVRGAKRRGAARSPLTHFFGAAAALAALVAPGATHAANGTGMARAATTAATTSLFAHDEDRVRSGTATPVSETIVRLTAGTEVRFETTEVSAGSDPILHLLFLSGDGEEVAFDDNGGPGSAARLRHVPAETGYYLLVLRATSNDSAGSANILQDGASSFGRRPFGGWQLTMNNLRQGERIQTVKLPGSTNATHKVYVLRSDGGIASRQSGGGPGGAAHYVQGFAFPFLQRTVVVGVAGSMEPVRLLRNDLLGVLSDWDNDGLGAKLEEALETCSFILPSFLPAPCSRGDATDTDGDGLSDGWEVLGRSDVTPKQPLPKWGADPRHKDMFVEVDFRQGSVGEPAARLLPEDAREFATIFADELPAYPPLQQAAHASDLGNPDGRPGISVHLDTGVDLPSSSADVTLFGDWGGFTSVPPVEDADGSTSVADATTAWKTAMNPARRGAFHYAMTCAGGCGGKTYKGSRMHTWVAPYNNARTHAHEAGHHLGLGHRVLRRSPWT